MDEVYTATMLRILATLVDDLTHGVEMLVEAHQPEEGPVLEAMCVSSLKVSNSARELAVMIEDGEE